MIQRIKQMVATLLAVPLIAASAVAVVPAVVSADSGNCSVTGSSDSSQLTLANGAGCAQGNGQQSNLFGQGGVFKTITNVMLFLIGAISVIMLIIGGIRYVISGGDSSAVQSAKNTILYAIVGVVVAILAYAVVNFVIGSFASTSTS